MFRQTFLSVTLVFLALTLCRDSGLAQRQQVDLNSATAGQLDELPGIGPAIAQRILEFRRRNGPFKRVEELMNVRGIGEKTFLKLRDLVTVGSPAPAAPAGGSGSSKPSP